MATPYKDGLEDIIAARSAICRVDGEAGRLYYRGYEVADLVGAASFEDTTRLLQVSISKRAVMKFQLAQGLPHRRDERRGVGCSADDQKARE